MSGVPFSTGRDLHVQVQLRVEPSADSMYVADGMAVLLQSSPAGTAALGGLGSGMGYSGITPSVAVELDTFQNMWDPRQPHVAITHGGDPVHTSPNNAALPAPVTLPSLQPPIDLTSGPTTVFIWVDYAMATKTLQVSLSLTATKPVTPALTTTALDLTAELGPTMFVGLTASTAMFFSRQWLSGFVASDGGKADAGCCARCVRRRLRRVGVRQRLRSPEAPVWHLLGHQRWQLRGLPARHAARPVQHAVHGELRLHGDGAVLPRSVRRVHHVGARRGHVRVVHGRPGYGDGRYVLRFRRSVLPGRRLLRPLRPERRLRRRRATARRDVLQHHDRRVPHQLHGRRRLRSGQRVPRAVVRRKGRERQRHHRRLVHGGAGHALLPVGRLQRFGQHLRLRPRRGAVRRLQRGHGAPVGPVQPRRSVHRPRQRQLLRRRRLCERLVLSARHDDVRRGVAGGRGLAERQPP